MFELKRVDEDTVAISGRFDAAQVKKAYEFLEPINHSFTVDMSELEYISSAGLGVLVSTYKRLDGSGHKITLSNLSGHIVTVFKFSGLDRIFTIK